jgi:putative ABC transport system permease protein
MRLFYELRERARALLFRDSEERELSDELRFHLELETERLVRAGVPAAEAARRARVAFGGVERVKEDVRDARGTRGLDNAARDVRHATRALRKSPGFAAAAILTLALGIGANAAIFTLVDSILLRPLPYPDAERLVTIGHAAPGLNLSDAGASGGTYLHYRAQNQAFEEIGAYYENAVELSGGGDPERVHIAMATPSLFSVLGAKAAAGRVFVEAEERKNDPVPVLISHELWRRRFGSDPDIVGRIIHLNRAPREVIGVLESGFDFPRRETAVWYADAPSPSSPDVANFYYSAVGRLKPGVRAEAAALDLNRLVPSLADAYDDVSPQWLDRADLRALVRPLKDTIVGDVGSALWALMGGMAFVLLIACANVANLFLVRAEHRQKEVAVRVALGAGRGDLARFLLSESLLLSVAGGVVGVALAWAAVQALTTYGPQHLPRLHEIGLRPAVLAFAGGLSLAAGLAFGALAVLRHARPQRAGRRAARAGADAAGRIGAHGAELLAAQARGPGVLARGGADVRRTAAVPALPARAGDGGASLGCVPGAGSRATRHRGSRRRVRAAAGPASGLLR